MQARIKSPAMTVPGVFEAMRKLGASASNAGIPETTHQLVHLRASQINGCSVCVDMHSRELARAGEPNERISPSRRGARRRTSPLPSGPRWL